MRRKVEESKKIEELEILVNSTLKILESRKSENFPDIDYYYLSLFIKKLVDRVLHDKTKTKDSKVNQIAYAQKQFFMMKLSTQEAISIAFQASMEQFSKVPMEYYCTIKLVPQASSVKDH